MRERTLLLSLYISIVNTKMCVGDRDLLLHHKVCSRFDTICFIISDLIQTGPDDKLTISLKSLVSFASKTGTSVFVPTSFLWLSSEKWPLDND